MSRRRSGSIARPIPSGLNVAQWQRIGRPGDVQLRSGTVDGYRHGPCTTYRLDDKTAVVLEDAMALAAKVRLQSCVHSLHDLLAADLPLRTPIRVGLFAGEAPAARCANSDVYNDVIGAMMADGGEVMVGLGGNDQIDIWAPPDVQRFTSSELFELARSVYAHEWGHVIDGQYRLLERRSFARRWHRAQRADAAHMNRNRMIIDARCDFPDGEIIGSTWLPVSYIQSVRLDYEDFAESVSLWAVDHEFLQLVGPNRLRLLDQLSEYLKSYKL